MEKNVLLLDLGDTGSECEAIRQTLEYFGYHVLRIGIGRPNDFVEVLKDNINFSYTYLIISCHGSSDSDEEGSIIMPELADSIYLKDEPRGNFGSDKIKLYLSLKDKIIINTGCATGIPLMAKEFTNHSNNTYIGPNDFIDGSAMLHFVNSLFYFLESHTVEAAYKKAASIDSETKLVALYNPLDSK